MQRIKQLLGDVDRWLQRHRSTRVARRAALAFMRHEALQYAGSMAYYAVLSVFQLLVLGVVVVSFFLGEGEARRFVVEQVEAGTPIDAETATAVIDGIIQSRGGIGVVSIVFLAWGALGLFSALNRGISRAFPKAPPRPFWQDKLIGLLLMSVTGVLAVASVAIGIVTNIVLGAAQQVVEQLPFSGAVLSLFAVLVPLGLMFVAFLIIYRVVPNRAVALSEIWPGALLAAILWSILRIGFTYYATNIANYDSAFGPISTAVTLLVFLYFASVVVLLGAELARANVVDEELAAEAAVDRRAEEAAASSEPRRAAASEGSAPPAVEGGTSPRRRVPRWAVVAGAAVAGIFLGRKSRRP